MQQGGQVKSFMVENMTRFTTLERKTICIYNPNEIRQKRTEKSLKRAQNPIGARIKSSDDTKLPTDLWSDIRQLTNNNLPATSFTY